MTSTSSRWITIRSAVLAVAFLAACLAMAESAAATPEEKEDLAAQNLVDPPPDYSAIMRAQIPLDNAAGKIKATFKGQLNPGFTSLAVKTSTRELIIYWKGEVPTVTEQAIESVRKQGVNVSVLRAQYSRKELQTEIEELIQSERENVPIAYRAHTYNPLNDGSGIEISVPKLNSQTSKARMTSTLVRNTIEEPPPIQLGRLNDASPYSGGARLNFSSTTKEQSCTSGFGVISNGLDMLLTAAHCGGVIGTFRNGQGDIVGSVGGYLGPPANNDVMLVQVDHANGYIYGGAWNESSNYGYQVVATSENNIGDSVCTSGSYSGEICGITITDDDLTVDDGFAILHLVNGHKDDGTSAGGGGDSGGPVFLREQRLLPLDGVFAHAKGTLANGDNVVPCTGFTGGRTCFSDVRWVSIQNAFESFGTGMELATGYPDQSANKATDTFTRSVASGLGRAEIGGEWTVGGNAVTTSVVDGSGRLSLGQARTNTFMLNSVSMLNTDLTHTIWLEQMPTGAGAVLWTTGRSTLTGDYRVRLDIAPGGTNTARLVKVVGSQTVLTDKVAIPGGDYTINKKLRIRIQTFGTSPTTIRAKVWPANEYEPTAWLVSTTDSTAGLQQAGSIGLATLRLGVQPTWIVRIDDLAATERPDLVTNP